MEKKSKKNGIQKSIACQANTHSAFNQNHQEGAKIVPDEITDLDRMLNYQKIVIKNNVKEADNQIHITNKNQVNHTKNGDNSTAPDRSQQESVR